MPKEKYSFFAPTHSEPSQLSSEWKSISKKVEEFSRETHFRLVGSHTLQTMLLEFGPPDLEQKLDRRSTTQVSRETRIRNEIMKSSVNETLKMQLLDTITGNTIDYASLVEILSQDNNTHLLANISQYLLDDGIQDLTLTDVRKIPSLVKTRILREFFSHRYLRNDLVSSEPSGGPIHQYHVRLAKLEDGILKSLRTTIPIGLRVIDNKWHVHGSYLEEWIKQLDLDDDLTEGMKGWISEMLQKLDTVPATSWEATTFPYPIDSFSRGYYHYWDTLLDAKYGATTEIENAMYRALQENIRYHIIQSTYVMRTLHQDLDNTPETWWVHRGHVITIQEMQRYMGKWLREITPELLEDIWDREFSWSPNILANAKKNIWSFYLNIFRELGEHSYWRAESIVIDVVNQIYEWLESNLSESLPDIPYYEPEQIRFSGQSYVNTPYVARTNSWACTIPIPRWDQLSLNDQDLFIGDSETWYHPSSQDLWIRLDHMPQESHMTERDWFFLQHKGASPINSLASYLNSYQIYQTYRDSWPRYLQYQHNHLYSWQYLEKMLGLPKYPEQFWYSDVLRGTELAHYPDSLDPVAQVVWDEIHNYIYWQDLQRQLQVAVKIGFELAKISHTISRDHLWVWQRIQEPKELWNALADTMDQDLLLKVATVPLSLLKYVILMRPEHYCYRTSFRVTDTLHGALTSTVDKETAIPGMRQLQLAIYDLMTPDSVDLYSKFDNIMEMVILVDGEQVCRMSGAFWYYLLRANGLSHELPQLPRQGTFSMNKVQVKIRWRTKVSGIVKLHYLSNPRATPDNNDVVYLRQLRWKRDTQIPPMSFGMYAHANYRIREPIETRSTYQTMLNILLSTPPLEFIQTALNYATTIPAKQAATSLLESHLSSPLTIEQVWEVMRTEHLQVPMNRAMARYLREYSVPERMYLEFSDIRALTLLHDKNTKRNTIPIQLYTNQNLLRLQWGDLSPQLIWSGGERERISVLMLSK